MKVDPQEITIIGAGHVGLVAAACFAKVGHLVVCLDKDAERISAILQGQMPFYEPGMKELVTEHVAKGTLRFTTEYAEALEKADFVFIAVGTPTAHSGQADLRFVREAGRAIAENVGSRRPIVVSKSTAPVGISQTLEHLVAPVGEDLNLPIVANPEFLREATAIQDFLEPDRIVLGSDDVEARLAVGKLYEPFGRPIIYTDIRSAEMIKYASNAFLATKISFINEIAEICERVGADVRDVSLGMGLDHRINPYFLNAGLGFGGSCLPKDVKALSHLATVYGSHPQMLNAVLEINTEQLRRTISRLRETLGGLHRARIAILGLAFKPGTDDIRESPAIELARLLEYEDAIVTGSDPVAIANARQVLPSLAYEDDPYEAVKDADALVIATDWPAYRDLDLVKVKSVMRTPVIADGRNLIDAVTARSLGFIYFGIGLPESPTRIQRPVLV